MSTGNSPQKTTGLLGLNPGKASCNGLFASHIVSPTFVSDNTFIPVVIKPINEGSSLGVHICSKKNLYYQSSQKNDTLGLLVINRLEKNNGPRNQKNN